MSHAVVCARHRLALMLRPDQERWAEALQVIKMHGDDAEAFCWNRINALVGDPLGEARWRDIRRLVKQVREAGAGRGN